MPFFSPRGPVSHAAAEAFAKGVKRGMAPETRIVSSEKTAEAQTRRSEEPLKTAQPAKKPSVNKGFLTRLRSLFPR